MKQASKTHNPITKSLNPTMSMFKRKKADGRIRIQCHECGKRLKLPADNAGRVFRCPICATTIVAPLDAGEGTPGAAETFSKSAMEKAPSIFDASGPEVKLGRGMGGWRPKVKDAPENKSIERLVRFANRENERVRDVAVSTLDNPDAAPEQKERRLTTLRAEKNKNLRAEIEKIVESLDDEIRALARGPESRKADVRARLEKKLSEKEGLLLFLRIIYGLKLADTHPEDVRLE